MRQMLDEAKESGIGTVSTCLVIIIVPLFTLGIIAFTAMYFKDPKNPWLGGSFLGLAQVMAIFSAFGWAGGFSGICPPEVRKILRLVGLLYLMTSLAFCMMSMLSPLYGLSDEKDSAYITIVILISVACLMSIVTFAWGTLKLGSSIPYLWKVNDDANDASTGGASG